MQYTDRLGQPLAVGDTILIAIAAGRSSASLREVTLAALIPLVPHRDKTEPRMERIYDKRAATGPVWCETGKVEGRNYMREDHGHKSNPTAFYRKESLTPDKLFVLQYERPEARWPSGDLRVVKQAFDRVLDVVKVPHPETRIGSIVGV